MHQAATFAIRALAVVFLVGILGSTVVVVITFFEHIAVLFRSDKTETPAPHLHPL